MKVKFPSSVFWTGVLITITATAVNLLIFALAHTIGEGINTPISETSAIKAPMPVMMVIVATIVPSILAVMLYSFVNKISPNGVIPPFLSVSITALIVSFGGPISLPETDVQTKIFLISMHITTGLIMVGGLILFHKRKY